MSYENEMLTMQDGSIQSVYNLTPDLEKALTKSLETLQKLFVLSMHISVNDR